MPQISLDAVLDRAARLYAEQLRHDRDPRFYLNNEDGTAFVPVPSRQVKALAQAMVEEVNKALADYDRMRLGAPGE